MYKRAFDSFLAVRIIFERSSYSKFLAYFAFPFHWIHRLFFARACIFVNNKYLTSKFLLNFALANVVVVVVVVRHTATSNSIESTPGHNAIRHTLRPFITLKWLCSFESNSKKLKMLWRKSVLKNDIEVFCRTQNFCAQLLIDIEKGYDFITI